MSVHDHPRSYTTFRAIVGSIVVLIGGAVGWALWTWVLPSVGIDLSWLQL
jgi:hypothetical protein